MNSVEGRSNLTTWRGWGTWGLSRELSLGNQRRGWDSPWTEKALELQKGGGETDIWEETESPEGWAHTMGCEWPGSGLETASVGRRPRLGAGRFHRQELTTSFLKPPPFPLPEPLAFTHAGNSPRSNFFKSFQN